MWCSSLPPLEVLHKLRLQRPDVFNKIEGMHSVFVSRSWADRYNPVYIDGMRFKHSARTLVTRKSGGISRGTDVIKALCLGARAVGLGRPFLYAQSVSVVFSWMIDNEKSASDIWGRRRRKDYPDSREGNCYGHEARWCSEYRRFTPWNGKHTWEHDLRGMIMFPIRLNVSTGSQGWRLSYEILREGNYLKALVRNITIYRNAWD